MMKEYISLNDISFGYKKTGFRIDNLSLKLYTGETTILVGKNGCGKTTVSKLIMSILKIDSGEICLDGESIRKKPLAEIAKCVGYLFQQPERQLFNRTALEEITFSLNLNGLGEQESIQTAKDLLEKFDLKDKEQEYPLKLSRGEKQRLALAAVFAMKPNYYILDEPSSGLDSENKQILISLLKQLKKQGAGLLIITHDREMIKSLADRLITMEEGGVSKDEKS